MDKVRINNLSTRAVIGVYDFEKIDPQPLQIDLELETDFSAAFVSDDLADVIDYDAVAQTVRAFCEASRYQLIEALVGGIITTIMTDYDVGRVTIAVRKPNALKGAVAEVVCSRSRQQMTMI